ncbi:MAG TPA: hypothetical protein VES03_05870 [Motilibacterales bacterium]|nr:hypothetical protein [Motilibacterales bacterium]
MRTELRLGVLATVVAGALALSGGSATAVVSSKHHPTGYTCTGGEIKQGNYASITVTGACSVQADAVINVVGNVNVAAGAMLDAHSAPSVITVGRNVTTAAGSFLLLGCQPPSATGNSAHVCTEDPEGASTITVNGNVTATDAHTVMLNGITVNRNVTLTGGGSFIPWSIKNNTIDGNLTVSGQTVEWLGVLFNTIGKNATLTNITVTEDHPEASYSVFIVSNTVGRNLTCRGLAPGVSGGWGGVNVVGRNANGQCASLV